MRHASVVLLLSVAVPCYAAWTEVGSLAEACRAGPFNVTFSAGDALLDGNHVRVVGTYRSEDGPRLAVLRTIDGRRTWTAFWTDIAETPANAVDFVDANRGRLLAGNQAIYRTNDGGRTWTRDSIAGGTWSLHNLQMANAWRGYASGWVWEDRWGAVFSYDTDLNRWQQVTTRSRGTLNALSVHDVNNVWSAGAAFDGSCIGRRSVGGEWSDMDIPSAVRALGFVDSRHGYAACSSGRLFETLDAGSSWREKATPVLCDFTDMCFPSGAKGMLLSAGDEVALITEDGGNTWIVERAPANAVDLFWDGSTYLLLTRTGLSSWQRIGRVIPSVEALQPRTGSGVQEIVPTPGPYVPAWHQCRSFEDVRGDARLKGASFVDDNEHAWVLGDGGRLFRTRNGGVSWERLDLPRAMPLTAGITFADANNGWLWGSSPCIWRTEDGGVTWTEENVDGGWSRDDYVVALEALGPEAGVAVAGFGGTDRYRVLQRATETGVWTITENSLPRVGRTPALAALGSSDPRAWLVWFMTTSWNGLRSQPYFPRMERMGLGSERDHAVRSIFFLSPVEGWACADILIYATGDGGRTWTGRVGAAPDPANYPIDVAFRNVADGYAITRLGQVLGSRDGGVTWRVAYRAEHHDLISVHWFGFPTDNWWVVAEDALYTNSPEPSRPTLRPVEPLRPRLAGALLSWSAEDSWLGDGVHPDRGSAGREAVFRVQWDRRSSGAPAELQLLIEAPGARFPTPVTLRPADYWAAQANAGVGDWGAGYTPPAAGTYNYRFRGTNEAGEETTGQPTEWRTWTVE